MAYFKEQDRTLLNQLYKWENKHLDDIPITELSNLKYILEHLPQGIEYTIKSKYGDFKYIHDYCYQIQYKYFDATEEDYKSKIGECYINDDKTIVMKVVGIRDDYDNPYYKCDHCVDNFLYEKYFKHNDGSWHIQDYIWLQETAKGKHKYAEDKEYLRWCLTNQTEMNVNAEGMFMLGKDGNFYIDTSCGGDYEVYRPFSKATFELIREEAIKNDGEYQVEDYIIHK